MMVVCTITESTSTATAALNGVVVEVLVGFRALIYIEDQAGLQNRKLQPFRPLLPKFLQTGTGTTVMTKSDQPHPITLQGFLSPYIPIRMRFYGLLGLIQAD